MRWLLGAALASVCLPALAQTGAGQADANSRERPSNAPLCQNDSNTECGWWWKLKPEERDRPKPKPQAPQPTAEKTEPVEHEDEIDCSDPDQWAPPCGFVDPNHSFAFQSKQRDALRQRMAMNPNDPSAVRGFQEYNNWALNQAIAAADMWKFNSTQDPSLNPALDKPTSRFGLKLLDKEKKHASQTIYQMIRDEDGFFVWFTRSDCPYCHGMLSTISKLQDLTGIPVHNASLDGQCMDGFDERNCLAGDDVQRPAATLKVRVVPDLMLYLPNDQTWIRLATGVVTLDTIQARIKLFVGAMQSAYENAVKNSETDYGPNVDFINTAQVLQNMGMGKGVSPAEGSETPNN